jgi:hypothetical protein
MGKKKNSQFAKFVSEALSGADETKGMNAKMIVEFIRDKQPIEDEKEVSSFVEQIQGRPKYRVDQKKYKFPISQNPLPPSCIFRIQRKFLLGDQALFQILYVILAHLVIFI